MVDWQQLASIIAVTGGIAVTLRFLWIQLPKGYRKLRDSMLGYAIINEKIDHLAESVERLTGELVTNSGTSIKDSLLRLEYNVALTSERQRARMLDSPELVYEADVDGNCVWVNRTYARAVQRGHEELMGKGWINVIAESDRDEVDQKWYESVEEDREFEMRIMYSTPDGVEFPVMVRSYKMRQSGETIGFLGTVTLL